MFFSKTADTTEKFSEEAIPLVSPSSDSSVLFDSDDEQLESNLRAEHRQSSAALISSAVLCLLTACVSILVMVVAQRPSTNNLSLFDLQSKSLQDSLQGVRRPSQFLGLEKINRTSTHELSIINFPFLVARIDESRPSSVLTGGRVEIDGLETHLVEITRTISSVVQFRCIDWKLETCTLHLHIPAGLFDGDIDVYSLRSDNVLDANRLTFNNRPGIENKVASIRSQVEKAVQWHHGFHCSMDSIHTFLLTSDTSDTAVSWRQNGNTEHAAVFVSQRGM
ncbi:hypothetical protein B0H19DRAFT_1106279 [Mycena capillaripes]|nr:hypothetical protein B0H19DRAFT_1106279 [Mycena capillaripes]